MYTDPLFVAAEIAYRKELFAPGPSLVAASRRHGHGWTGRLHVRLPHRHTVRGFVYDVDTGRLHERADLDLTH